MRGRVRARSLFFACVFLAYEEDLRDDNITSTTSQTF